jgi:hypothetical protein
VIRRRDIAFAHRVAQLQLGRVHAQGSAALVHLDIERVVGLHHAVAANAPAIGLLV